MTSFHDWRKLGQIHESGSDGRLVVIDAEHLDRVLAGIAGEVLNTLQRVNVLEDLDEVLWKHVDMSLEPRR